MRLTNRGVATHRIDVSGQAIATRPQCRDPEVLHQRSRKRFWNSRELSR